MMGQQQEIVAGSKTLLRRIVLALLVAALMAAMALGGAVRHKLRSLLTTQGTEFPFQIVPGGAVSKVVAAEVKCLLPMVAVPVLAVAATSGVLEVAAEEEIA